MKYEKLIIGAGMYGMYAANRLVEQGYSVLVIDCDKAPFQRGSLINQARLHNGYHYPRSYATASKSAHYFERFMKDFADCVNIDFTQVYAIASEYSWTNAKQFEKFCNNLNVKCDQIQKEKYFNPITVESAYITHEYSFDAEYLREKLYNKAKDQNVKFIFEAQIKKINKTEGNFEFVLYSGEEIITPFVLNATYAGTNQIHNLFGYDPLPIKYELCEVILCNVSDCIKNVGLTVMDGPFFSVMPFGKTGYHSITTVSRTPHITCYENYPSFECQKNNEKCNPYEYVENCNSCKYRPESSYVEMAQIAKKYLNEDIKLEPVKSLFTLKPILRASEIDDSRPTIIRQYSEKPYFYTVFSGKINTMYDLDEIL